MRGTFSYRRSSSVCAAVLGALVCLPLPSFVREARACGAPTFSEIVEYTDVIFVGKVVSVTRETETSGEDSWEVVVAAVKAETVLKGAIDVTKPVIVSGLVDDEGEEETASGKADPLDAKTLLVMASWDDEHARLACDISRDVTRDDARDAYTSSVRELITALSFSEEDEERYRRGTEWAVKWLESEVTRDDALRELERFCRFWKDEDTVVDMLDASQRERLVDVMVSAKSPDASYGYEIAGTLGRYRDGRVLGYLQDALARQQDAEPSPVAGWLMSMVAEQMEWKTGQWLADKYPYDGDAARQRKVIARFLKLMQTRKELPEALAAQAEQERRIADATSVGTVAAGEREQAIREAEERFEFTPAEEVENADQQE